MTRLDWTPERDAYVRRWTNLKTAAEIGADLGCTENAIHKRRKRLGISARCRGQSHHNARLRKCCVAMIRTLSDAGFTLADIHRLCNSRVAMSTLFDVATGNTWHDA